MSPTVLHPELFGVKLLQGTNGKLALMLGLGGWAEWTPQPQVGEFGRLAYCAGHTFWLLGIRTVSTKA
jgi:hypothetical protein